MNRYLWQYVMQIDPFVQEEDIQEIQELNEWDLLIVFKNGRKVIYDRATGYFNNVFYSNRNKITDEQEKKEFARRLRSLMTRRGITQEQLADILNSTQSLISRYATGETIPGAVTLNRIAKILNCSMDDFFYKDY